MSDNHYREFGFLKRPISGEFLGVEILPLSDHSERSLWVEENSHRDGFFYPPQVATYKLDHMTLEKKEKIEKSERPATVFKLMPSHQIRVDTPVKTSKTISSDDALIINLLGYIYGTRLQFSDWNFDGRIPLKSINNIYISDKDCFHFLEHVYRWWRTLDIKFKIKYINILYVLTRARSFEWKWEKFAYQYMIFDAIFKLHKDLNSIGKKKITHRERFDILMSDYEIPSNNDLVDKIYTARNNLFHEAMWAGTSFGFSPKDLDTPSLPLYLDGLNSRLICGLAHYKNEYSTSRWWTRQMFLFNQPDES